jgi:hypothetical protein
MTDDNFYAPDRRPVPPRVAKPGELLFEFVRQSDRKHFRCELRFNGESYGWEAQFFEGGEILFSHGLFHTRAAAVEWAESQRRAVENRGVANGCRRVDLRMI